MFQRDVPKIVLRIVPKCKRIRRKPNLYHAETLRRDAVMLSPRMFTDKQETANGTS